MNETGEMALNRFRGIWRSAVFVLAAALASQTAMPASTVAAKEGVYVSSDVFFYIGTGVACSGTRRHVAPVRSSVA